jgi:hypothetical protein
MSKKVSFMGDPVRATKRWRGILRAGFGSDTQKCWRKRENAGKERKKRKKRRKGAERSNAAAMKKHAHGLLIPILGASFLTAVAAFAQRVLREDSPWLTRMAVILNVPGALFVVLLAVLFVPSGGHNTEPVEFLMVPFNLIFYASFFYWIIRRRSAS